MAGRLPPMPSDPSTDPPTDPSTDPGDVASRRRARRWWWATGIVLVGLTGWMMWLGRQSVSDVPPAPKAFCKAAERYEKELDRQAAVYERDVDRQIRFVEDIVETAPRRIRSDAETFLDALRRVKTDPSVQDDPAVKRAVDNVNRYWNQGCGVFDRQGGI